MTIEGWRPRRKGRPARWGSRTAFRRARFAALAVGLDLAAVTASAAAVGIAYHALAYGIGGMGEASFGFGLALAALFVVLNASREGYAVVPFPAGHGRRLAVWNTTFALALVLMFAVKETATVSRASTLLVYLLGFAALAGSRAALVVLARRLAANGRAPLCRAVLVGSEAELRGFVERYDPAALGTQVVASAVLRGTPRDNAAPGEGSASGHEARYEPGNNTLVEDLALAAAIARVLRPDDVFILLPWSDVPAIDAALAAFGSVPAAIHLGPQPMLERFGRARVSRVGPITSLNLVRHPLTPLERAAKRAVDVAGAAALLLALAPLAALLALLIRLDSPGPVFFIQRRHGFDRQSFRILKFRSMHVTLPGAALPGAALPGLTLPDAALPDAGPLRQAVRGDARVTRVGRLMRRTNLDELPQLLNVLRGEMSLVGPRPHALAHNLEFERTVADYARRHNVKPGLTGWAQVHGLRGETATAAAIEARLAHDLHYIDNWSLGLDLAILGRTVLSPRAYRNAY